MKKGYVNKNSIAWLTCLLRERYGVQLELDCSPLNLLEIRMPGSEGFISLSADVEMFNQQHSDLPCSEWDCVGEGWQPAIHATLKVPGLETVVSPLIEKNPHGFHINYDILGLTYWMLNRCEELGRSEIDEHGRFPSGASHAVRFSYLHRPLVDEWLYILKQVIERTWPGVRLIDPVYKVLVSHDVDRPSRYHFGGVGHMVRAVAGDVVRRRRVQGLFSGPFSYFLEGPLGASDPYNTFSWLMDRSEMHGLKSAFYFICGRTDRERDALYSLSDPAIVALIREIHSRGHEIGLHPSYRTFDAPKELASEARLLRETCIREGIRQDQWGGRMHYLRWQQSVTLRAWNSAGLSYDSTLGYADRAGFRCGTCHEFPAFDPAAEEQLVLRIRPLVAMDVTFISQKYNRSVSQDLIVSRMADLADSCRAVNGQFVFLWHNSELWNSSLKNTYDELLGVITG